MSSPHILTHWKISGSPSYSPEFSLPAVSGRGVLVIVAKQIKPPGADLTFKLQKQSGGKWQDELDSSGTSLSGSTSVHYVVLSHSAAGLRRLEAISHAKGVSAEVDIVLAGGRAQGAFSVVQHPIEELGPDVVKKLPALQDGLERSLADALGQPAGTSPPQTMALTICGIWSVHVHPPNCPFDAGSPCPNDTFYCNILDVDYAAAPTTKEPFALSGNMAQFLLANRLKHEGTPAAALDALASRAGTTTANLQSGIDKINALTELLSEFFEQSKSPSAP